MLDSFEVYSQLYQITGMPPGGCLVLRPAYTFVGNETLEYLYLSDENEMYGIIKVVVPTSDGEVTVYAYILSERLVKIGEEGEPT